MKVFQAVKRVLIGRKLESSALGETLLPKRIALPVFASDALSSVAYAPEEIFLVLSVAGLAAYSKLFADAHARDNVRMNNVLPGWIDSLPGTEERRESVPMQRYGKAEEIAATVSFLVSEGAGYITGQSLRVDGGLMRSV